VTAAQEDEVTKGGSGGSQPAGKDSPHLEEHEQKQAAEAQAMPARVIHEVLREEGEVELRRPVGALLWSGLAAGLSMGFSFLTLALLKKSMAGEPAAEVIAPLGYGVGFLIAVLGKQQLFTETTLTATLPLFHQPTLSGFGRLGRMWAVVLFTNLVGTIIFAWLVSWPGLFGDDVAKELMRTARGAYSESFGIGLLRAMFAGWLIALIVWLLPASKTAAPFVIAALTYVVALAGLPHIIAGSTEAAYAVFNRGANWGDYFESFLAPTLLGNLIGGTALAALLNHAPVAHDMAARKAGAPS
jgi:formate/nitrite transporter FocA (FNT family)